MKIGAWKAALALFISTMVFAQQGPEISGEASAASPPFSVSNRPKVGLALSGGGARGAAHVGVLRVLEELKIPIDYIAGTSMGSIVGGLYACGMSPDQIEKILLTTDWDAVFNDRPPRKSIPFRKKQDDHRYIMGLEAGVDRKGLHFGKGLVTGQQLGFLLESLTLPAETVGDFDMLPIPFRCVATDIVTGEKIVLSKGNLAQSIRASMSIPAVFTPVELDGRLLVDGGLAENVPVETVREMGADIVIAVDIGTPPLKREEIGSFLSVSGQAIAILMQKNVDASNAKADILIKPPIGNFSNMDFINAGSLIPIGEKETREMASKLERFKLPDAQYAEHFEKTRTAPRLPDKVDFIKIEGTSEKEQSILSHKIEVKAGEPLKLDAVNKDLERVYNTGDFESVSFRLLHEQEKYGVLIKANPNPLGPIYARFGIRISSDFNQQSDSAVLAGLRWTKLNSFEAEWKTDIELGLSRGLTTEFYQPLNRTGRFFIAPSFSSTSRIAYSYDDDWATGTYRATLTKTGIDLGLNLGRYGEIRIGPQWGRLKLTENLGEPIYPGGTEKMADVRASLLIDTLDSTDFPTKGQYLNLVGNLSIDEIGADYNYNRVEGSYRAYKTFGKHTFFGRLSAGSALGSELPFYSRFYLGGGPTFAGYKDMQLHGDYYGVIRAGYYFKLARLPSLFGEGYYFMSFVDVGNTWMDSSDISWDGIRYSGSVALAISTKLGPMYLGYSYAKGGYSSLFLSIGKRF